MTKQEAVLRQMSRAVVRLGDALAQEETEFMRDSAIQRFEFTLDETTHALCRDTPPTDLPAERSACNILGACDAPVYKDGNACNNL